jgi:excisionase family DNA binding protein
VNAPDEPETEITTIEKVLLTPSEAWGALGIGKTKLFELVASGELQSVCIGRARRIPATSLRQYVDRLTASASSPAG